MRLLRLLCLFGLLWMCAAPQPLLADHVQGAKCGVSSGKFARICRPSAATSCMSAVKRGVQGYSEDFCNKRQSACSSCLELMQRCIAKIGHGAKSQYSCDECPAKFSRCIGKKYPILNR